MGKENIFFAFTRENKTAATVKMCNTYKQSEI